MSTPLGTTSPHGEFRREPANPIPTAGNRLCQINTVFNPSATTHDGKTVLPCRAEDCRITISYTACGPAAPATTEDFQSVEKPGAVMPPEDKSASLPYQGTEIKVLSELVKMLGSAARYALDGWSRTARLCCLLIATGAAAGIYAHLK